MINENDKNLTQNYDCSYLKSVFLDTVLLSMMFTCWKMQSWGKVLETSREMRARVSSLQGELGSRVPSSTQIYSQPTSKVRYLLVYQVWWGRKLSCEQGKEILRLWVRIERGKKGKGRQYRLPFNIEAVRKNINRGSGDEDGHFWEGNHDLKETGVVKNI